MALLLVAVLTTFFTILVHSLLPGVIVRGVLHHTARGRGGIWLWDVVLVIRFTLLALAAHFVEIALWALSFYAASFQTSLPPSTIRGSPTRPSEIAPQYYRSGGDCWNPLKQPMECSCSASQPP